MNHIPFYDPSKSYEDNFRSGPFGAFTDGRIYKQHTSPRYTFLNQPVHLPFGIAAGPLLNSAFVNAALDKGFDLVICKTVRTHQYPCHPWPNVIPVKTSKQLTHTEASEGISQAADFTQPLAITNSFGVPSADPAFWQEDMKKSVEYAQEGQVVIGSFQGTSKGDGNIQTYIDDFVLVARLVKETGCKVLEANLSCPNEGTGNLLCYDIERTKKIAFAIKEEIGNTPLILKMAYFEDQNILRKFVQEVGPLVQGLATINTIPGKILKPDGTQALPGKGRLISGVCGAPIKWAGLDMVQRVKQLREELNLSFSIVGVGGLTQAEEYQEYRNAGADAVMCATGAMWNPYLAQEIKELLS